MLQGRTDLGIVHEIEMVEPETVLSDKPVLPSGAIFYDDEITYLFDKRRISTASDGFKVV